MSRRLFGWDLPPGVTSRMIDEAFGMNQDEDCECEAIRSHAIACLVDGGLAEDDARERIEEREAAWDLEIKCEYCKRRDRDEAARDALEPDDELED